MESFPWVRVREKYCRLDFEFKKTSNTSEIKILYHRWRMKHKCNHRLNISMESIVLESISQRTEQRSHAIVSRNMPVTTTISSISWTQPVTCCLLIDCGISLCHPRRYKPASPSLSTRRFGQLLRLHAIICRGLKLYIELTNSRLNW